MASRFEVIPAIDLLDGGIVRLEQGSFARATHYPLDPVEAASAFAAAGADRIHLVDLDGARAGQPHNLPTLRRVADTVAGRCLVEAAGGLRSADALAGAFAAGADRVVLGTAAIRDPLFAGTAIQTYGAARVAIAIDVRGRTAIGDAWRPGGVGRPLDDVLGALDVVGATTYEVTAIDRDGTRSGPDLDLLAGVTATGRSIVASGGIATIADVLAVRDAGCAGVIVGRALYEGDLELASVLAALGPRTSDQ